MTTIKVYPRQTNSVVKTTTISSTTSPPKINVILGRKGDNAYELAKKNGFVGTEQQWLTSLHDIADNSVTPKKTTFISEEESNPDVLQAFVDAEDKILTVLFRDGRFRAIFDYALSKITMNDLDVSLQTFLNNILAKLPTEYNSPFISERAAWVDEDDNKLAEFTVDGKLKAIFDYALSKITLNDLDVSLQGSFPTTLESAFVDYLRVYLDDEDSILFGIKKNGAITGLVELLAKSITESHLSDSLLSRFPSNQFLRQNAQNSNDFELVEDDGLVRGVEIELPIRTSSRGYLFAPVPRINTKALRGVNQTGFAIEVRNAEPIVVAGERKLGIVIPNQEELADFSAISAKLLLTYKGWFMSNSSALPSNPSNGDYYLVVFNYQLSSPQTLFGVTLSHWDYLYYNNGWNVQACPVAANTLVEGDFFNVVGAGKFGGLTLAISNRLVYRGKQSGSGWDSPIWSIEKNGEFFCMGEFIPNSFSPVSVRDYDFYIANSDGVFSGIDFKKGDYLLRIGSAWGKSASNLITVANNMAYSIEYKNGLSVRRADKNTSTVDMKTKCNVCLAQREINNNLVLFSDSMFGVNVGASISSLLTDRVVSIESYGGATTQNVLQKIKAIATNTDTYLGRIHVFWHGQNNNGDLTQIKTGALEMARLCSVQQNKFIMWSMLGQLNMSWNGTRLVDANHEDAFNRVNNSRFNEIEYWYDIVFRGKHFATRKQALLSAVGRTRKSLHFPTMTEAQVANIYGIPPLSYFFKYDTVSWNPDSLIFLGYHSAVGLPTGGINNNYYVRVANGSIGNIIVNVAGTWTEYTYDATHVSIEGGKALANQFTIFINTLNY